MSARPVLILAGGTGGHVYPALAVSAALRAQAVPVHWIGGAKGLETRLVPAAGIAFTSLPGRGLRGTGLGRKLFGPPRLAVAVARAWRLIRTIHPRAALGFGGYASGAGGLAAWLARCPLVVHEQNAIVGATNKTLGRLAARRLEGFEGAFAAGAEWVGNPVREEFTAIPEPRARYRSHAGPLRLLIAGGSQGASILNEVVPAALARMETRFAVRHVAGPAHIETARSAYAEAGVEAEVVGYEEAMWEACAWADLAITRAGALTVAELAMAGLPALLVPFPAAVDDHQSANARVYEGVGAGRLLPQDEMTAARLAELLAELAAGGRAGLLEMAAKARSLARPQAAERVARVVLEVGEGAA
ncbi:MAG: undecaprenyldiphospho-muramoylpentapeptide beta-N-acetylglucosaminyltransferase [Gammaproteobacteria bacterium]|nr:undecaprenyldiphospho-muramoylpentapeptide beta-N-acetylglucosaminyltransferase [Gammaproteobacteria bacterium]